MPSFAQRQNADTYRRRRGPPGVPAAGRNSAWNCGVRLYTLFAVVKTRSRFGLLGQISANFGGWPHLGTAHLGTAHLGTAHLGTAGTRASWRLRDPSGDQRFDGWRRAPHIPVGLRIGAVQRTAGDGDPVFPRSALRSCPAADRLGARSISETCPTAAATPHAPVHAPVDRPHPLSRHGCSRHALSARRPRSFVRDQAPWRPGADSLHRRLRRAFLSCRNA